MDDTKKTHKFHKDRIFDEPQRHDPTPGWMSEADRVAIELSRTVAPTGVKSFASTPNFNPLYSTNWLNTACQAPMPDSGPCNFRQFRYQGVAACGRGHVSPGKEMGVTELATWNQRANRGELNDQMPSQDNGMLPLVADLGNVLKLRHLQAAIRNLHAGSERAADVGRADPMTLVKTVEFNALVELSGLTKCPWCSLLVEGLTDGRCGVCCGLK